MSNWTEQPCWHCKNFCGGCEWSSKNPQPVEGWIATPTIKRSNGDAPFMQSFAIDYCPKYEDDGTGTEFTNNPINSVDFDGQKLKELMKERGITHPQMAREIKVCSTTISRFCTGNMIPLDKTKEKMAKVLHLSYEDFILATRKD